MNKNLRPFRDGDFLITFLSTQQFIGSDTEVGRKNLQFNIGDKPFPCLNPLNGIFVQIKSVQLQLLRKSTLRKAGFCLQTELPQLFPAEIMFAAFCLILIHSFTH